MSSASVGSLGGWGQLTIAVIGIIAINSVQHVGSIAVRGRFESARQDFAIDGWCIDVTDKMTPVEVPLGQLGHRITTAVGGGVATFMAAITGVLTVIVGRAR